MTSIKALADDLAVEKICLTAEGDGWIAVCHPDISPDDEYGYRAGSVEPVPPFNFRFAGEVDDMDEVGIELVEEFQENVDEVFRMVDSSDNPLDTIMEFE